MDGMDLSGGEADVMLLVGLVPAIAGLLLTYLVIRLAVRHALRDAHREGLLRGADLTTRS